MIRRLFILMSLLVGLAPSAIALENSLTPEEEELIREIGIFNSAIGSMAGRFLQIDSAGGRLEGTFFLVRPNKIRFRYAPPSREEIVSVGRGFYILNREEETKYVYPQDKVPLRQFLTDEIDFLNGNISDVVMTDTFISITLFDESPLGTVEVALIFEIESKELWQWTLTEPDGSELTFSIYDVVKDVEIPRSFFYINPNYRSIAQ
ncbi:hypothetical protein MNBD_ALPHA11-1285 [hydrothermal vent metagenome]|uniref:Outer membrane lipoprotein carrier protein LolA n=1 Tax=hydrothermal vent metagenome TaxID=652676 RepID=A0A3B0UF73_9ZZZZ